MEWFEKHRRFVFQSAGGLLLLGVTACVCDQPRWVAIFRAGGINLRRRGAYPNPNPA
jgi:hypothetical protein